MKPWLRAARGWYATFGGRQVALDVPKNATKRAAKIEWAKEAKKHSLGRPTRSATYKSLLLTFLAEKGKESRAYRDYGSLCGSLGAFLGDTVIVDQIIPNDLSRWLKLKSKTWSVTAQCKAVTHVKGFLNWARKQGLIDRNPLADFKAPRPRVREFCFTEDQLTAAFAAARPQFAKFIRVLVATGMRPSELAAANKEDAAEDGSTIHIRSGKTRQSRRTVAVPESLRAVVVAARRNARARHALFTNDRGVDARASDDRWSPSGWAQAMEATRERAKLPSQAVVYALRHTAITRMMRAGIPAGLVAAATGTSLTMIDRTYGHLQAGDIEKHLAKLDLV